MPRYTLDADDGDWTTCQFCFLRYHLADEHECPGEPEVDEPTEWDAPDLEDCQ